MGIKVLKTASGWEFRCPGCLRLHQLGKDVWRLTGSEDLPTFEPGCIDERTPVCSFRISAGRIYFESESQHALAGQGRDLPEMVDAGQIAQEVRDAGTPYAGGLGAALGR